MTSSSCRCTSKLLYFVSLLNYAIIGHAALSTCEQQRNEYECTHCIDDKLEGSLQLQLLVDDRHPCPDCVWNDELSRCDAYDPCMSYSNTTKINVHASTHISCSSVVFDGKNIGLLSINAFFQLLTFYYIFKLFAKSQPCRRIASCIFYILIVFGSWLLPTLLLRFTTIDNENVTFKMYSVQISFLFFFIFLWLTIIWYYLGRILYEAYCIPKFSPPPKNKEIERVDNDHVDEYHSIS